MSNTLLRRAVRSALAVGAIAGMAQAPAAFAQEEDAKDLGSQQVTGSRLSRADIETAQPVTVIDRDDINLSGDTSVAEVLQTSVFNSFGSFRATSGFANGQAAVNEVSLRGLGSNRTLVLLDGRRISSTGGSGGAAQNLNQIPLAVVERIEILRDGASAVYGSDAIAGVINVITRKDFDGVAVAYTQTFPGEGGDNTEASATVGVSSAKGNIYFTVAGNTQRPQYYRDIDYAAIAPESGGITSFGFPATVAGASGVFIDPRCPSNIGDSAEFPNSYQWGLDNAGDVFLGSTGPNGEASIRCAYNFAADIMSVPRAQNLSALVKGTYDLSPSLRLNSRVVVSQLVSDQRFAGTPVSGPFPTIPAFLPDGVTENPINPYELFGLAAPEDFTLLLRTVANGTRDNNVRENSTDVWFGLEGDNDWMQGTFQWNANVQFNRNDIINNTFNLVNKEVLQSLLDNGQLDVFGVNGGLDEELQQTANHTGVYDAEIHRLTVDLQATFDMGSLPAGPISWAWGLEYNDTDFFQVNDVESNRGVIAGSAGGDNIETGRVNYSAFFETNLPLLDNLDLTLAGRFETYNDPGIGGDFTPAIGIAYRPIENLLLRATYNESFRAPAFDELYGNISEGFPASTDFYGAAIGVAPNSSTQYRALTGGNPELNPEQGKSWTYGFVYSPIDGLDIDASFYHTEFDNFVTTNSLFNEFSQEFDVNCTGNDATTCNPFSAYVPVNNITRNADGTVNFISLQSNNFEGISTEGIEVNMEYRLSTDASGDFTIGFDYGRVLNYDEQIFVDDDVLDRAGLVGTPDERFNPYGSWEYGDLSVGFTGRYIAGQSQDAGGTSFTVSSHFELDVQASYNLPWDGAVTVGAQNVTDEEPELNADFYGWEPFDFSLYNTLGAVPYIRYTQNF